MNQEELFERSRKVVPGGVHSPVRSFKGLHTTPRFIQKANKAFLYDEEGKDYIDFCMSFGPLILGHRNPQVEADLQEALGRGWSYGACERYSLELAEYLVNRIDHIEQIRFVNSGTEAVMTAVRLVRGVTGRSKIVKFNGCYHGHLDAMLIKAGSGLAGTAEASSSGITEETAQDTLICELGDKETLQKIFEQHGDSIAAVAIEPLPANNGLLPQGQDFLKFVRDITTKYGALLLFDEVISGFRIGFGGMAEKTGIKPDMVTYGKIIGGGLPVGAVAASKEIMEHLAPVGNVYQAGTLSANPLAMVAGLSTLKQLNHDVYRELDQRAQQIVALFVKWMQAAGFEDYRIIREQSLFWQVPSTEAIDRIDKIPEHLQQRFHQLFHVLLDKGIYLSPNAYEIGFVSMGHDQDVVDELERRLWN